jgi:tripartite-type tricarboxylate transporter receptor subunit TctC
MTQFMTRRSLLAGAALGALAPRAALAQGAWPTSEVRLFIPASPGGSTDLAARLLKQFADRELGATLVPVNQTGGGGTVATESVITARPDGGTLLIHHALLHTTNLFGRSPRTFRDLSPIATISEVNNVLVARGDAAFRTLPELQRTLAGGGRMRLASQLGGTTQVMGQAVARWAGGNLRVVDAGPEADRVAAILGSQVELALLTPSTARQYHQAGELRVLALFNRNPDPLVPDWPTAASLGLNVHFPLVFTIYAPPNMPEPLRQRLGAAIASAVRAADFATGLTRIQQAPSYRDEAATRAYLAEEFNFVAEMVRAGAG